MSAIVELLEFPQFVHTFLPIVWPISVGLRFECCFSGILLERCFQGGLLQEEHVKSGQTIGMQSVHLLSLSRRLVAQENNHSECFVKSFVHGSGAV